MEVLSKHRGGLNAIARALLDNEIIDGAEVARLVDEAHGSPVHGEGAKSVPHFHEAAINAPVANGANGSRQRPRAARRRRGDRRRRSTAGPSPSRPRPPPPAANRPDPDAWPPPPWPPPADPSAGATGGTPGPLGTAHARIEPIRAARRHEGGWWSTSSQSGSRTGTSPPSAPPA